jgi:hypothetical protein
LYVAKYLAKKQNFNPSGKPDSKSGHHLPAERRSFTGGRRRPQFGEKRKTPRAVQTSEKRQQQTLNFDDHRQV